MKIGIFDSGRGGVTVMTEIQKVLPEEEYIYLADSKNCPYGSKTVEELKEIVSHATDYLLRRGAKIIVIACNTATTQMIGYLREKYPDVPFVGTEPAIKKACDETKKGAEKKPAKILLMATEGTAHSKRTEELIKQNLRAGQMIEVVACEGLAKAIEEKNEVEIERVLSEVLSALKKSDRGEKKFFGQKRSKNNEFKTVILGCTHYPLIREQIQKKFPSARLIDGNRGVALEVKRVVEELEK